MKINITKTASCKARRFRLKLGIVSLLSIVPGAGALALVNDPVGLGQVGVTEVPQAVHIDQMDLLSLTQIDPAAAFALAFAEGDELFEVTFNALDGVGADVGNGERFTRVPRADLAAWFGHMPERATGPNGQACNECHNQPFDDGAGTAALNVHRDPMRNGLLGEFIRRDTPHVFGIGALQRLAEEMTERLHRTRDAAARIACRDNIATSRPLATKGVSYGTITAMPSGSPCVATFDTLGVEGVNDDLIIRPLQWKGSDITVREFNRGASHNELGMQPVETTGVGVDGDGDGIVDEMTIGDQTGLAIYLAAQPRPTTRVEMASLGLIPALTLAEKRAINRGRSAFIAADCQSCHKFKQVIKDPIFSEPSQNPNYRDATFPSGQDPVTEGVDPAFPIMFDLTADQPDNHILLPDGSIFNMGAFESNAAGGAIVRHFSDLKLHDMGPGLAESIDESGAGASVWITKELWGVGSTAPYLHDGRATTLAEAILEHGGEADASRLLYEALPDAEQKNLVDYLKNQVLFKLEEPE